MSTSIFTRASAWAERSRFAALARQQFAIDAYTAGVIVSTADSCAWGSLGKFVRGTRPEGPSRLVYIHVTPRGGVDTAFYVAPVDPSDPIWAEVLLEIKRLEITDALARGAAR